MYLVWGTSINPLCCASICASVAPPVLLCSSRVPCLYNVWGSCVCLRRKTARQSGLVGVHRPSTTIGSGRWGGGVNLTARPATIVHNWAKIRTRATRVSVKCFQLSTMKDHRVLTFQALSFVGAKERERETGSFPSLTVGNRKAVTVGQTTSHLPCLRFPLMKGKTQNVKILWSVMVDNSPFIPLCIFLCCQSKTDSFVLELAISLRQFTGECMDLSAGPLAPLPLPPWWLLCTIGNVFTKQIY